jgi:hypothetical protein
MLEMLRILADAVSKALPALTKARRENKLRKLGAELFLLYVQINEALICAGRIVSSLEVYIERMSEHRQSGRDGVALNAGEWISFEIEKQTLNLARIGQTMQHLRTPLQIVDATSYAQLEPLIEGKRNALDLLLRVMRRGRLPIGVPSRSDALELIEAYRRSRLPWREGYNELVDVLESKLAERSVSSDSPWGENTYQIVSTYLETRKPRDEIAMIRAALDRLRECLEQNFSIQDVLLEVGDEYFDDRYNGQYFW